jgi:enoyl-CoA hydratase/carnithine racemase
VVAPDQLEAAALALAAELAAKAPLGLALAKQAIEASLRSPAEALRASAAGVLQCLSSPDFKTPRLG